MGPPPRKMKIPLKQKERILGGPGSLPPPEVFEKPKVLNIKKVIRNHIEDLLDKYSDDSSERINLLNQLLDEERNEAPVLNIDADESSSGPKAVEPSQGLAQWGVYP